MTSLQASADPKGGDACWIALPPRTAAEAAFTVNTMMAYKLHWILKEIADTAIGRQACPARQQHRKIKLKQAARVSRPGQGNGIGGLPPS